MEYAVNLQQKSVNFDGTYTFFTVLAQSKALLWFQSWNFIQLMFKGQICIGNLNMTLTSRIADDDDDDSNNNNSTK